MAKSCLCAIAGALPPDFVDASPGATLEKQASMDAQGNFDPNPINTAKWVVWKCTDFVSQGDLRHNVVFNQSSETWMYEACQDKLLVWKQLFN